LAATVFCFREGEMLQRKAPALTRWDVVALAAAGAVILLSLLLL
jgi:hypothetical protein